MKVELCPQCGSGKVARTSPLADTVKCDACSWAGKESALMSANVAASSTDIAFSIAQKFLILLVGEISMPVGRAMIGAGLIQAETDKVVVGRLIRAAVTAAHRAALEEIDKIQQEITNGPAQA